MTREEEIKQVAKAYYGEMYHKYPMEYFTEGAKWADAHPQNPWISVEDKLPEKGDFVFVRFIGLVGYTAMHVTDLNKEKRFLGYSGYKCTHWMPIPELPK